MQGLFMKQFYFVVQRRDICLQRHETESTNGGHSTVAYMLKVGSAWTDITRLYPELLKPFSFNNISRMTIKENEISNSLGDGKGRRSSKSPLFQHLTRSATAIILLHHSAKKHIKAIHLHFLHRPGEKVTYSQSMATNRSTPESTSCHYLLSPFASPQQELFRSKPFGDTWKILMFRFSMMSKWIRATKIICPGTFYALHMIFASAWQLDLCAKKQTQLPDCIIEFLRIITTIDILDRNQR